MFGTLSESSIVVDIVAVMVVYIFLLSLIDIKDSHQFSNESDRSVCLLVMYFLLSRYLLFHLNLVEEQMIIMVYCR